MRYFRHLTERKVCIEGSIRVAREMGCVNLGISYLKSLAFCVAKKGLL